MHTDQTEPEFRVFSTAPKPRRSAAASRFGDYPASAAAPHAVAVHSANRTNLALTVSVGAASFAASGRPSFSASAVSGNQTTNLTNAASNNPDTQAAPPNTNQVAAADTACGSPGNQALSVVGCDAATVCEKKVRMISSSVR